MDAFSLNRRRAGAPAPLATAAIALGAIVVGVLCGRLAVTHYGQAAIEALIVVPLLIALWSRPLPGLVLVVALMGLLAYGIIPRANVPGHPPLNLTDLLLAVIVGGTLWRRHWSSWPTPVQRYARALCVLLVVGLVPTLILAVHGHSAFRQAILGYKNLLYASVALTIALEFSTRLWRPFLAALLVLSAVIALISVLAAASSSVANAINTIDKNSVTTVTTGTVARIRLPGLFFAYGLAIPALAAGLLSRGRWRVPILLTFGLILAAIATSLNRNMYFGVALGLIVTSLVAGPRFRYRIAVAVVTVVAIIAVVAEFAVVPAVTAQFAQRAQSALSTQVLQTGSAQARADEFSHALDSISRHPLFGVGWLQSYGAFTGDTPRAGVEDIYLHMATDFGVPAALAFFALPAMLLAAALRRVNRARDAVERALLGAGIGAMISLLLSCVVGAYLQDINTTMMFGVVSGFLLAVIVRIDAANGQAPARSAGAPQVAGSSGTSPVT